MSKKRVQIPGQTQIRVKNLKGVFHQVAKTLEKLHRPEIRR